jgi:poly-gamma-glutamate synthesis protein (capsule biosynthesis protein)
MDDLPEAFEDDEVVPRRHRVRAEGRSLARNAWSIAAYLSKYRSGRPSAASATLRHVEAAREHVRRARIPRHGRTAEGEITLGLVGDLMWLRRGWTDYASALLRVVMDHTDVWLGNLETPVHRARPVRSFLPDYVRYNAPPDLLHALRRLDGRPRFHALSVANNHALDQGDEGALDTLAVVRESGTLPVGLRDDPAAPRWACVEAGGFRIGVHAATWGLNDPRLLESTRLHLEVVPGLAPVGARPVDLSGIRSALAEMAEARVDLRVVLLHWGHEFELYPDPLQLAVAREIAHAGADLVAGAHAHVPQPPEILRVPTEHGERRALILYSLGNFVSAMWTLPARVGLFETLTLRREPTGSVAWELHPPMFVVNERAGAVTGSHRLRLAEEFTSDGHLPFAERRRVAAWLGVLRAHVAVPGAFDHLAHQPLANSSRRPHVSVTLP